MGDTDRASSEGQDIVDGETLCPECGIGVSVDEDGCCVHCGATATGRGVRGALAEIQRLRAELAEVKYWNGAIAVCQEHVEDIVSEDPASCVVCDLERLRAALSEQEPAAMIRALRNAYEDERAMTSDAGDELILRANNWLARTQSPKEGDDATDA